ncbi:MAG: hypothetical protein SVU32_04485 [Candidatus Nanohaloarchaea archaeon]|nr:hypothetical protein [Candidatus Nanohaloarchaea archaeon]
MTGITDIQPSAITRKHGINSPTAERFNYDIYHATTGETPVYIKEGLEDGWIDGNIAAGTVLNHLGIDAPATHYLEEKDMLLIEDLGDVSNIHHAGDETLETDESLIDAVLGKYIVGDLDVIQNIMYDGDRFYPIDFDHAGTDIQEAMEKRPEDIYDQIRDDINLAATFLDGEHVAESDVRERAATVLHNTEPERLEQLLLEEERLDQEDASLYRGNLEYMQDVLRSYGQ